MFLGGDEESLYGDESVMGFESPEARNKVPAGLGPALPVAAGRAACGRPRRRRAGRRTRTIR